MSSMSIEFLNTRRSMRRYTDEPLADEDLQVILNTAMLAPSSKNRQPWRFVVVTRPDIKEKLIEHHQYMSMAKFAAAVILVCGDLSAVDGEEDFLWPDCSAATMNILYAAKAQGYGACWCAVYPYRERMKTFGEILGLPENVFPFSAVTIGRPGKENPPTPDRFDAAKVHYERW